MAAETLQTGTSRKIQRAAIRLKFAPSSWRLTVTDGYSSVYAAVRKLARFDHSEPQVNSESRRMGANDLRLFRRFLGASRDATGSTVRVPGKADQRADVAVARSHSKKRRAAVFSRPERPRRSSFNGPVQLSPQGRCCVWASIWGMVGG